MEADKMTLEDQVAQYERPLSADAVLSNEELVAGGLAPVQVWARTKASKNALRVQKHREKAQEQGLKQVNVVAPEQAAPVLKALAKATPEQIEAVATVLAMPAPAAAPVAPVSAAVRPEALAIGEAVLAAPPWKRALVRWLCNAKG